MEQPKKWSELCSGKPIDFMDISKCIAEGLATAIRECPDSQNKTFEELAI